MWRCCCSSVGVNPRRKRRIEHCRFFFCEVFHIFQISSGKGEWGDGGGSGDNGVESDGMLWKHPLPWSQMIWLESCAQGCFARDEEYCGFFGGMERRCR
mgnify:CR=1 FL=1